MGAQRESRSELVPRGAEGGRVEQRVAGPGGERSLYTPGSASGAYAVEIYCAEKRKTFAMSEFVCSALWRSKSREGLKRGA